MSEIVDRVAEAIRPYLEDSVSEPSGAAEDAIAAYRAALAEAGYVIVPREPTPAMLQVPIRVRDLKASDFGESVRRRLWRAMVGAASQTQ